MRKILLLQLKLGEFTFKFFAQKEAKPQRNRYTLMLKMMNEQELPVSIKVKIIPPYSAPDYGVQGSFRNNELEHTVRNL